MVRREVEGPRSRIGCPDGPSLQSSIVSRADGAERSRFGPAEMASRKAWYASMGRWKPAAPSACSYNEQGPKVGPDRRVCLVLYFYWMDREFGLMHVKIQTWFPFTVQVYVNGHEWLARKLAAKGIGFRKVDNAFVGWLTRRGRGSVRGDFGGVSGRNCSIVWPAGSIRYWQIGWPVRATIG